MPSCLLKATVIDCYYTIAISKIWEYRKSESKYTEKDLLAKYFPRKCYCKKIGFRPKK